MNGRNTYFDITSWTVDADFVVDDSAVSVTQNPVAHAETLRRVVAGVRAHARTSVVRGVLIRTMLSHSIY